MGIERRNFLKTLGFIGFSLTGIKSFGVTRKKGNDKELNGILFDSTRCVGCQSCEVACAEKNGLPTPEDYPEVGVVRKTNENRRVVVNAYNTSKGEQYMRNACNHCINPACASSCLTKAMLKTDEGPVTWDGGKCLGCRSCMISCPFEVPKFEYNSANPKIQKCTMCYDRIQEGSIPACVEACPAEALQFGKRSELLDIAKSRIYNDPDNYNHAVYGEYEVGGTGVLYLASVPFEELGLRTDVGLISYPEYNKTFLYSVPLVLILWPAFLLGLKSSVDERKKQLMKEKEN